MSNYQEVLETIRSRANIVDVIGERIELKRKGRNIMAVCPFHDDHRPSLSVSESKQIFKCFSCGMGGDIFKFIIEFDKVEFKEAVKILAQKYQIKLPQKFTAQEKTYIDPYLKFKSMNKWASEIYHRYLFKAKNAEGARNYIKSRKISRKLLETFKIGFAPSNGNFLVNFFKEKEEFKSIDLVKSGLFFEQNRYWRDFFFNRIIFPIINEKNETLGFGGRVLTDIVPKYLNSKDSSWFKKREILYGLRECYAMILKKKKVFVVEGYLDVMACYHVDLPAVAPLGTALTDNQIVKLKRYADKIHLFFDGDRAGRSAAIRSAIDLAINEADGNVYLLPEGDPFDFLQSTSTEHIDHFFEREGINIYEFIIKTYSEEVKSPVDKKQKLEQLFKIVNRMKNSILKEDFIHRIEKKFEISWKSIEEANQLKPRKIFSPKKRKINPNDQRIISKERGLILFLCNHPDLIKQVGRVINPKEMLDRLSQYVYHRLSSVKIRSRDELLNFNQILELFPNEKEKKVVNFLSEQAILQESMSVRFSPKIDEALEPVDELNQRIVRLKLDYIERERKKMREKVKQLDDQGNEGWKEFQEKKIGLDLEQRELENYLSKI